MKTVSGRLVRQARLPAAGAGAGAVKASSLRQAPRRTHLIDDAPAHPSFLDLPPNGWEPALRAAHDAGCAPSGGLCCLERLPPQTLLLEAHNPPAADPERLRRLEGALFAVQVGPPAPPGQKGQKHSDYYANVGDAIRTLRDDIPQLFAKDLDCELLLFLCAVACSNMEVFCGDPTNGDQVLTPSPL